MHDRYAHEVPKRVLGALALAAVSVVACAQTPPAQVDRAAGPPVVLLHGLNRTRHSMGDLAAALRARGRQVVNLGYPSARFSIAELAAKLGRRLDECCQHPGGIDFVTHSLGGILVRELHRQRPAMAIRRVVMLAPPNQGSEVADALRDCALFKLVTGPPGQELGTGPDSVPNRLGPVGFTLGVIAGTFSVNPVFSRIVPGEDDGTVAVSRARVAGMADFITVPASHTFIMHDREAIARAVQFIETGRFSR